MPIYKYLCLDCDTKFDAIRPMSEADKPIQCNFCAGERTIRKISVFFAQSGGKVLAGSQTKGCAGCSGGSCSSCGH
jgi:putative FmdB family regulatory protein